MGQIRTALRTCRRAVSPISPWPVPSLGSNLRNLSYLLPANRPGSLFGLPVRRRAGKCLGYSRCVACTCNYFLRRTLFLVSDTLTLTFTNSYNPIRGQLVPDLIAVAWLGDGEIAGPELPQPLSQAIEGHSRTRRRVPFRVYTGVRTIADAGRHSRLI